MDVLATVPRSCRRSQGQGEIRAFFTLPGGEGEERSVFLSLFIRCSASYFAFTTASDVQSATNRQWFGSRMRSEGVAMLIRSENVGVHGTVAIAAGTEAIPAALLSNLLLGGLLLLICP
jgi:hypothetical protein